MDLNELLAQHQIAMIGAAFDADAARRADARCVSRQLADRIHTARGSLPGARFVMQPAV